MEAVAFTLHLLSKVHGLLAHPTLLPSSPVWHPAGERRVRGRGRALWAGMGQPEQAWSSSTFPQPQVQRAATVLAGAQTAGLATSIGTQGPSSGSCSPGSTGPVCQGQQKSLPWSRGTSQLLAVPGKGRKQHNAGREHPQSQPGTSSGHSPPATVRVTGTEPWCCSDRAAAAATAQTQPQLLLPDPAQALQGRAQSGLLRAGVPLTPPRPRLWHRSHSTISSCLGKPSLPGTPCTLVPQSPPGLQAESEPGESESKKTKQGTDLSTA